MRQSQRPAFDLPCAVVSHLFSVVDGESVVMLTVRPRVGKISDGYKAETVVVMAVDDARNCGALSGETDVVLPAGTWRPAFEEDYD